MWLQNRTKHFHVHSLKVDLRDDILVAFEGQDISLSLEVGDREEATKGEQRPISVVFGPTWAKTSHNFPAARVNRDRQTTHHDHFESSSASEREFTSQDDQRGERWERTETWKKLNFLSCVPTMMNAVELNIEKVAST